ncbi:MAG: TonB-dependent receptor, partial [Flavobacterium sp.]
THVAVAEATINPESKIMLLKAGFRMNYFQDLNVFVPEIRLQYSQQVNRYFRVEVLGEQKSQTMSQVIDRQQDFLGIEKRRWTLADGEMYPLQRSNQLSIGISFRRNNWLVTLDNFYKEVTGITTSEQGFQDQLESVSAAGKYRVLGSELLVQKNFGRYYAWLNYSLNDNRYDFAALSPEYFPNNFELVHAVAAAAIYEWHSMKIAVGAKWHSGRPVTSPVSAVPDLTNPQAPEIIYNDSNNSRLPDFFQMNFSASKDWKIWKVMFEAGISVVNLLNTRNVVNRFYRVSADGTSINRYDTSALDRTPNVHLKISF